MPPSLNGKGADYPLSVSSLVRREIRMRVSLTLAPQFTETFHYGALILRSWDKYMVIGATHESFMSGSRLSPGRRIFWAGSERRIFVPFGRRLRLARGVGRWDKAVE